MDRLLGIDPHELIFDFEIGQRCTSFVTLKNVMFTMPVAFKITAPAKKYTVKPGMGIIPPAGRVTVEVSMNPQPSLPETFLISTDKFVIKSVVVPGGNQHSSVSNEWFESKKHYVYSDSGLRVLLIGECILRALVSKGSMEDVREMLERGVDLNRRNSSGGGDESAMHLAISNGRPEMVQLLLEFGADLEVRDRAGKTALHKAAASGQSLIAELLLAKGAETESQTESGGWTALHFAVNGRHVETVRILLAKGANVNARVGAESRTALHIAAASGGGGGGASECLKLLLESGAAVNAVTSSGVTALHIAAGQGDLTAVRLLLDRGAMRNVVDTEGHIPFDAAMDSVAEEQGRNTMLDLLKLGDDLRRAARKGDLKSVWNCLKLGADVNGKDQNGWVALHCAAFKGHVDVVKVLLDKGANLNSVDSEGYAPLHCAVEMGHSEVVQILLRRGVDLNAQNKHGLTAVQVGNAMDQAGVSRLLVEAGARNVSMSVNIAGGVAMGKSKGFCDVDAPSKKLFNETLNGRRLSCETFG